MTSDSVCLPRSFSIFLSFFLSLPGLLTLGLVSAMSGGHLAAVWSSLCGEELRPPATAM